MLRTVLGRFKVIGILEGISFLLLLLVAMPLKYAAGVDQAVTIVGGAHGALFVLYIAAAIHAFIALKWSLTKLFWALVAAVLPIGTFVFEAHLNKEIKAGRMYGSAEEAGRARRAG